MRTEIIVIILYDDRSVVIDNERKNAKQKKESIKNEHTFAIIFSP